jgi:cell division protein FtsI/penicillin-binding protein 2
VERRYHQTESRNYPLGKATSHLLGYVGPINSEELKQKEYKGYKDDAVLHVGAFYRKVFRVPFYQ